MTWGSTFHTLTLFEGRINWYTLWSAHNPARAILRDLGQKGEMRGQPTGPEVSLKETRGTDGTKEALRPQEESLTMLGLFDLTTPEHLLNKLEREYERLKENPADADHAFNFFVTAEHLPGRCQINVLQCYH